MEFVGYALLILNLLVLSVLFFMRNQILERLQGRFERIEDKLDLRLEQLDNKLHLKLDQNLQNSRTSFEKLLERITKIDEAQKHMDKLNSNIVSLRDLFNNKKFRGNIGEITLYQIVQNVFGENNRLYQTQYKLKNEFIADLVLFLPEPTGTLCIDSKFPLENYQKMHDENLDSGQKQIASSSFKKDLKKHVDDIASKYILEGQTSDQAIMFIPSESIFSELHSNFYEVVEYSINKKVWVASPTTLMAMLTTIEIVLRNIERSKYADIIQEELMALSREFVRYKDRWIKLTQHIDSVSKDVHDIHVTTDKITQKFESIGKVSAGEKEVFKNLEN